jgi:hypothetical protein
MKIFGLLFAMAVLFFVAILLVLVFVGVGIVLLGCLILVGLILGALALPCFIPILIPLFIIWAIVAAARSGKTPKKNDS